MSNNPLGSYQDWTDVTWTRRPGAGTAQDKKAALDRAKRDGTATTKQRDAGKPAAQRLARIDNEDGDNGFVHKTVSRQFSVELQRARLAKKMTQKALAAQVNERATVINDYESGKAVPNQQVVQKLNRALGVSLPRTTAKK